MKSKIIILLALLFAIHKSINAQISKVTLQASGLTCSMCNLSIKKSLEKLPFVQEIKSDVETATFTILCKQNEKVHLNDIQNAVKKAGFSVSKLLFTSTFNDMSIPSNNQLTNDGNTYNFINANNKKLNGSIELKIIDKGFISEKEYKKYKSKLISMPSKPSFNVIII